GDLEYLYVRVRILVTTTSDKCILRHVKTSPRSGYITNVAFNGHILYRPPIGATFIPDMYEGTGIMISFPHFNLTVRSNRYNEKLSLEKWNVNSDSIRLKMLPDFQNGRTLPMTFTAPIVLRFGTVDLLAKTGFKMFYSIHPRSEMPEQLDTGLFNCSVPHYTSFRLHFDCNLETECRAGEDERGCPYTSAACGPGFIDAGKKCYRYVTVRKEITWDDAYQQCRSFGERLVSPRTPSEWQTFRAILQFGKKMCRVYVGLRSTPSHMAAMYRDVWQWTDQTMSYYINILEERLSTTPTCAHILPAERDMLQPWECGAPVYVCFLLCEKDK
ncbi:hypothetical protein BaRGS_00005726, partial [Batillaria attramentaria]